MQVVRASDAAKEPAISSLFTGNLVTRQSPFVSPESETFNLSLISFSAGSRNKFHNHTSDQVLIVTDGIGMVGTREDGDHTITVGDVVLIPAGQDHWHGAPGDTAMAHIAITAKGSITTQTEP